MLWALASAMGAAGGVGPGLASAAPDGSARYGTVWIFFGWDKT